MEDIDFHDDFNLFRVVVLTVFVDASRFSHVEGCVQFVVLWSTESSLSFYTFLSNDPIKWHSLKGIIFVYTFVGKCLLFLPFYQEQ